MTFYGPLRCADGKSVITRVSPGAIAHTRNPDIVIRTRCLTGINRPVVRTAAATPHRSTRGKCPI